MNSIPPQDNGSTANNLKLVIDYCAYNGCQEAWPRSRPRPKYDNDAAYPVLLKIKSHEVFCCYVTQSNSPE